tara:strand:- start:118 stop:498 length:381 start_codon:yes stop_codon:yes gene_type:complete
MKKLSYFAFMSTLFLVTACSMSRVGSVPGKASEMLTGAASTQTETLTVLSAVGGFSLIGGIVMLAITRGARGWFPCIGGITLVLLNYAVASYSHLIFYPLVVFTGLISGAWTYRIVRQILNERNSQ